jgi:hypothetical protein
MRIWVICQSDMILLKIVIVKLDGDLWLVVASEGRADKFIDNAANSVLKILLAPPVCFFVRTQVE